MFINGFPAPSFLPAAPGRARLHRSHQRIVGRGPPLVPTLFGSWLSIFQELRLSLAVLGENAGSRWGGGDPLRCSSHVHRLRGDSQCLSQRGISFHTYFDDFADGLVPRRAWHCCTCRDQRKRLCSRCRFYISCAPCSLLIRVPRALMLASPSR